MPEESTKYSSTTYSTPKWLHNTEVKFNGNYLKNIYIFY